MSSPAENAPPEISQSSSAGQSVARFSLWFLLGLLGSVGIAWISITIQSAGLAPLILSSLLVGAAYGGLLVLLSRLIGCGSKRAMLFSSFLLGLFLAFTQHLFAYQNYSSAMQAAIESDPKATLARTLNPDFGPADFWGYMQSESRKRGYLLMWIVDGTIIAIATLGMVWFGTRAPYCHVCHRWYKLSRELGIPGRLFSSVEKISGIKIPADATMTRYRWYHCLRGCGPAKVAITWVTADGIAEEKSVWLDARHRAVWDDAFQTSFSESKTGETTSP